MNNEIINNMKKHELYLSPFAALDKDSERFFKEKKDFRTVN